MTNSPEEFSDNNKLQNDSAPTSPEDSTGGSKTVISVAPSITSTKKILKEKKEKKEKKDKNKPINFATGISTSVPLTGERPMPINEKPGMDDDVLLAIFIILFEKDEKAQGMTVKQICDILVEKHPEMSTISSKTSNLVSAKLNAYVKKVEKGEKTIYYSLSRDWADSSPKRMVYVYRGVLAEDYPEYVQKHIEKNRLEESTKIKLESSVSASSSASPMLPTTNSSHFRNNSPFSESLDFAIPQLSIPYSVAPVTASLTKGDDVFLTSRSRNDIFYEDNDTNEMSKDEDMEADEEDEEDEDNEVMRPGFDSDNEEEDDDEDDDAVINYKKHGYYRRGSVIATDKVPSSIGKRSKSMSFINKRPKTLTTASMTPRISRKKSIANSPTAASAVAALRVAALNNFNISMAESVNSITTSIMQDTTVEPSISVKWLETVRSGFFNQDMESPENVTLAELETMFT